MSQEELQSFADILLEPKKKTENRKIIVIILVGLIPSTLLGIDIGKWSSWRDSMEEWRNKTEITVQRHESQISTIQGERNAARALKNQNAPIK